MLMNRTTQENREKFSKLRKINRMFVDLHLPPLDVDETIIQLIDEELLFLLLWEVMEFGYGRAGSTQLSKLWLQRKEQQMQDAAELV
jgi:hypothetical protein